MTRRFPLYFVFATLLIALCSCAGFDRNLEYTSVRSDVMRGARLSYSVLTPPDFRSGEFADERLPLITFLHGGGDDPTAFDRHGLTTNIQAAMAEGRVPRAVIYFPQGDNGFWENWYDGTRRYQDWITDELIPEVSRRFHTLPCPTHCHVMGVSMGGHGALRMAVVKPGVHRTITAISAPVFSAEQAARFLSGRMVQILIPTHRIWGPVEPSRMARDDLYHRWSRPEDLAGRSLYLAWGSDDREGIRETNEQLVEHLEERRIPLTHEEYEGEHAWVDWLPVIERAMRRQLAGPE